MDRCSRAGSPGNGHDGGVAGKLDREDRSRRRRQVRWTLLFLFAIALAGIGIAYALLLNDVLACPTPGRDSTYGDLSWSVLPPGPRCTWTAAEHGLDRVDGPSPVMSLWLLTLAGLAVRLVRTYRGTFPLAADPAQRP